MFDIGVKQKVAEVIYDEGLNRFSLENDNLPIISKKKGDQSR